jgi:Periplasmic binding protein
MNRIKGSLTVFLFFFAIQISFAQNSYNNQNKVYHVAIFAPMYLDSVFTNSELRSTRSIPKFIMPAVEFVQGARIALDTFTLNGRHVEADIYDSKSFTQPISWLIRNYKLNNVDLIIGSVKDPDYHELADFALQKNIPFVSATYPNDGGIKANPFLIIVNSTLKTHCEGIFSYLLQKHGTDKIYIIKRKGDDRIDNYFRAINVTEGKPLLNIKTIMIDSSITSYGLLNRIDTTQPAVIIGASLDESFAKNLADACYPIQKKHSLILIGMPNWDGFKTLYNKDVFRDFPIRFTTPHYDAKGNVFDSTLIQKYFQLYRAKPSDMAYKGFELTYYFTMLLLEFPSDLMTHLNDSSLTVFHDFNFRPVFLSRQTTIPDYYENKHLFIMEILNGEVSREW